MLALESSFDADKSQSFNLVFAGRTLQLWVVARRTFLHRLLSNAPMYILMVSIFAAFSRPALWILLRKSVRVDLRAIPLFRLLVISVLAFGFAMTKYYLEKDAEKRSEILFFESLASSAFANVKTGLDQSIQNLELLAADIAVFNGSITWSDFSGLTSFDPRWGTNSSVALSSLFIEVAYGKSELLEIQSEGRVDQANFDVKDGLPPFNTNLSSRDLYAIIRFIEPTTSPSALALLGFDLYSVPSYAATMNLARASGKSAALIPFQGTATGSVHLLSSVVQPIYRDSMGQLNLTTQQGDESLIGFAALTVDYISVSCF